MFDNDVGCPLDDELWALRSAVEELDVERLKPAEAAGLVERCAEAERLLASVRVLATEALAPSVIWRREGFRSPAAWMAAKAGTALGPAIATLEMASRLGDLPVVEAAFRAGRLSEAQAREIVDAASESPEAQQQLVDAAEKLSLAGLREECRRVKAAADTDDESRYRRIHRGRYLRSWTDKEGAVRLNARLTADEGARLLAEVDRRRDVIIVDALKGRWFESLEAHRADALVDLGLPADEVSSGPEAMVHVVVDHEALTRGHVAGGERCEIPGIGPVPVSVARRLSEDAFLKVIVTKGVDIVAVGHGGRTVPAHVRTALEHRDPKCIVPRCHVRRNLQIDHRAPWSMTRDTSLDNLARLCRWHHYQKSHLGYTYRGGPGTWQWTPPPDLEDPDRSALSQLITSARRC